MRQLQHEIGTESTGQFASIILTTANSRVGTLIPFPKRVFAGIDLARHGKRRRHQREQGTGVDKNLIHREEASAFFLGNQFRNPRHPCRRRNSAQEIKDEERRKEHGHRGRVVREKHERHERDDEDENRPKRPAHEHEFLVAEASEKLRGGQLKNRHQRRERCDDVEHR